MHKCIALLLAMLFLIVVAPIMAQNGNCDIDLSETTALLESAQAAADSGDSDGAAALMAEARAQLEQMEAVCSEPTGDMGDTADALPLGDPIAMEGYYGTLTFAYPSGWLEGESKLISKSIMIGSTESALDKDITQPGLPTFAPGEVTIYVSLIKVSNFRMNLSDNPDALEVLEGALGDISDTMHYTIEPTRLTINDYPAAWTIIATDTIETAIILIDLGVVDAENAEKQFGQIFAMTSLGEMAEFEPTIYAVAESFDLQ